MGRRFPIDGVAEGKFFRYCDVARAGAEIPLKVQILSEFPQ
jgi:hypothetical protein